MKLNLSAPKNITWIVALVLTVAALVMQLAKIQDVYAIWVALVAAVLLLLATWFEGL